jgi:hypothetical protein
MLAAAPPRLAVAAGRSAQLLKPIAGVSDRLLWSPEAGGSSMLVDTATQSARVPIKFDPAVRCDAARTLGHRDVHDLTVGTGSWLSERALYACRKS